MKAKVLGLFILLLLTAPAAVQAQYQFFISINASNANTVTITGCFGSPNGPGGVLNFPSNIENYVVTGIGSGMSGIFLPMTVTSITIPGTVTSIGTQAFAECLSLTNVIISNGVTSIGAEAFVSSGLTGISLPASVTSIGTEAFTGTYLTSVTLPGSVTSIGARAFYNTLLTSVTIPSSVTSIGESAFASCSSLTTIAVATNNLAYSGVNGVLFDITQSTLIQYPAGISGNYTVPGSVTSIGYGAFADCNSLTNVTIPSSVTSIEGSAFFPCYSLAGVYFTGNPPPSVGPDVFDTLISTTVYYLPFTTGWSTNFAGMPAVLWNPLIQTNANFGVSNNQFGFNITGPNNFTVVVEACTNVLNSVWTPLQTVTLVDGSYYFSDPQWTNYPNRFYGLGLP